MKKISELLEERASTHGNFRHNADISQALKNSFRGYSSWGNMPPIPREVLDMIAAKISRILSSRHGWAHADNWADIAGYATLAQRETEGVKR